MPKEDAEADVARFALKSEEWFRVRKKDQIVFIGIDPGATGAVAFFSGPHHVVFDIPTLKITRGKKKKTAFNYPAIVRLFRLLSIGTKKAEKVVCLEEPPPSMGPGRHYAEIMLARAYELWPLFVMSKGWELHTVSPSQWKKDVGLLKKDKDDSRFKAMKLFPKAAITRKKDHNRAEALLLAKYISERR